MEALRYDFLVNIDDGVRMAAHDLAAEVVEGALGGVRSIGGAHHPQGVDLQGHV